MVKDSLTVFSGKVRTIACGVVALHIVLAVVALILPRHIARHVPLLPFYNKFIILGPYFQASRLTSTWHLLTSIKQNGSWNNFVDHANENFIHYTKQPWRYDLLHGGDYENFVAWQVSASGKRSMQEVAQLPSFRALNQYVTHELTGHAVDSVALLYVRRTYYPEDNNYLIDTLFHYRYDPRSIAVTKAVD